MTFKIIFDIKINKLLDELMNLFTTNETIHKHSVCVCVCVCVYIYIRNVVRKGCFVPLIPFFGIITRIIR